MEETWKGVIVQMMTTVRATVTMKGTPLEQRGSQRDVHLCLERFTERAITLVSELTAGSLREYHLCCVGEASLTASHGVRVETAEAITVTELFTVTREQIEQVIA